MNPARILRLLLGLVGVAFWGWTLVGAPPAGLSIDGWRTMGVAMLMGLFWVSEILPFSVTALFPIVLLPASAIGSIQSATAPYANPVIFLFLGGIFIAMAMERTGLHRRIALGIITCAGVKSTPSLADLSLHQGFYRCG